MFPCTLTFASLRWPACGTQLSPGMCSCLPVRVEKGDLPRRTALVSRDQLVERRARIAALGEKPESPRPVAALGERLGRDGADARLRPGARRSRVERARLHRDAELSGVGIARDDRVRHEHDDAPPRAVGAVRSQSVSARRSAIATVVRFVFARGIVGMTEASATITPSSPSTRPRVSTTRPIPQVPAGWK